MWASRFQTYSDVQQAENQNYLTNRNATFTIPKEFIIHHDSPSMSFFHGGIDSPSLSAIDPSINSVVRITKYLRFKSKTISEQYLNHVYERVILTEKLSHPNVAQIISWYVADGCLYSITNHTAMTLRQAIESDQFSIERIRNVTEQILHGTFYLQSRGLCPLTPWYTTNIELTADDRVRLCSPTISNTKLNGVNIPYHHLWRHAPESLIRLFIYEQNLFMDVSKEDVWSIGCIIVEMMIHRILFHAVNDDPALQLISIVRLVGGLKEPVLMHLPIQVKNLLLQVNCDPNQRRLPQLLNQIFDQFQRNTNQFENSNQIEALKDLLKEMFRFDIDRRISLSSSIEHPFFEYRKFRENPLKLISTENDFNKKKSIVPNDLIQLCTKLNLKNSRWMLKLKECCLLQVLVHSRNLSDVDFDKLVLHHSLKAELHDLLVFQTG